MRARELRFKVILVWRLQAGCQSKEDTRQLLLPWNKPHLRVQFQMVARLLKERLFYRPIMISNKLQSRPYRMDLSKNLDQNRELQNFLLELFNWLQKIIKNIFLRICLIKSLIHSREKWDVWPKIDKVCLTRSPKKVLLEKPKAFSQSFKQILSQNSWLLKIREIAMFLCCQSKFQNKI